MGRNPRTGETVSIPRKNSVHFKPGSELKNVLMQALVGIGLYEMNDKVNIDVNVA